MFIGENPVMGSSQNLKEEEKEDEARVLVWDCGSPLYDSFELVSVSHILDRNSMILPFSRGWRSSTDQISESSEEVSVTCRMGSATKGRGLFHVALLNGFVKASKRKLKVSEESRKRMKATLHGFCASLTFWSK